MKQILKHILTTLVVLLFIAEVSLAGVTAIGEVNGLRMGVKATLACMPGVACSVDWSGVAP